MYTSTDQKQLKKDLGLIRKQVNTLVRLRAGKNTDYKIYFFKNTIDNRLYTYSTSFNGIYANIALSPELDYYMFNLISTPESIKDIEYIGMLHVDKHHDITIFTDSIKENIHSIKIDNNQLSIIDIVKGEVKLDNIKKASLTSIIADSSITNASYMKYLAYRQRSFKDYKYVLLNKLQTIDFFDEITNITKNLGEYKLPNDNITIFKCFITSKPKIIRVGYILKEDIAHVSLIQYLTGIITVSNYKYINRSNINE